MIVYAIYNIAVVLVAIVANIICYISTMPVILKVLLGIIINVIAAALIIIGFMAYLWFGYY